MPKPSHCLTCPLYSAPGPVWSKRVEEPKLIYIAEAPGREEVEQGEPMVGGAGRTFNRQLAECRIRRSTIFITNMVKCRPPGNRDPTGEEIKHCSKFLDEELEVYKDVQVVVLSGRIAFEKIRNENALHSLYQPSVGITGRAGCVEPIAGRTYIPTIHPAFIMRQPVWRAAGVHHLKKAARLAGKTLAPIQVHKYPEDQVVRDYAQQAITKGYFSDDVETKQSNKADEDDYTGQSEWKMTMCGFSAGLREAIVCKPKQIPLWQPAFQDPKVWRFEHNYVFDDYHISTRTDPGCNQRFDTMLATHYLRSFAPKALKPFVVSWYTDLPYYNRDLGEVDMEFYNGMDCMATLEAGLRMVQELKLEGLWEIFLELGMPLLAILEDMRQIGAKVDLRRAVKIHELIDFRIQKGEELLGRVLGKEINHRSSKQLKELFYEVWKLPTQYNGFGRNKKVTTDYEARKRLRTYIDKNNWNKQKYEHAGIVLDILDFLSGEEKKQEYISRISADQRIHSYFKAHGTWSFRLSSTPNLQNFPKDSILNWGGAKRSEKGDDPIDSNFKGDDPGSLRSIIIPDKPSHRLLTIDYSQMQLWIYAFQFDVKWLKEIFYNGEYLYGVIYEDLFKEPFFVEGKPKTKDNKSVSVSQSKLRSAKAVPLGFLFGRSAEAVAIEHQWTKAEATRLRRWFFSKCPEVERSWDTIRWQVKQQDYYRHIFGQKTWFLDDSKGTMNDAINSVAQSNEAMIMIRSIIEIANGLKERGYHPEMARIVLTVHDSLTHSVDESVMEDVYEGVVAPVLNRKIPELEGITLKHEAEVQTHWDWGPSSVSYEKWKEGYTSNANNRT